MKKGIIIVCIAASAAILAGGALIGIGIATNSFGKENPSVTNEHKITDTFVDFDIKLSTADLEFKPSGDTNCTVECKEKEKIYHTVSVVNNKLTIKEIDNRKWYEKTFFDFSLNNMKVTIYLPETSYQNLVVKASTSDIRIPHDFSFVDTKIKLSTGNTSYQADTANLLDIRSSTGDIRIENVHAKNIALSASTGDTLLTNVVVDEDIKINTSTGAHVFKNVRCANADLESSTGNNKFDDFIASGHLKIETSTGNVTFLNSDANTIYIVTDTGNVKGNLLTDKQFFVSSDTGKINVPKTSGPLCEIKTDTGDIIIEIKRP